MNRKTKKNYLPGRGLRVVSLFTGAGGLDLGFEQAGYETIYAGDFDAACCETLRKNVGKWFSSEMKVAQEDIRNLDLNTLPAEVDLVVGGPPCQTFSASGRRAGGASGRLDTRGTLFEAYCKVIKKLRPKAFLFENVRGILGTNKGEDWKIILSTFESIGYKISYRILDALDYGAPQQRERMVLVGHQLSSSFLFPEPLYGPDSKTGRKHISAGEALKKLDDNESLESLYLTGGKYGHLLKLVHPGDNYLYFTAKRGYPTPIFAYRSRFSDFLYKANPDLPIKTLIASPGKYTGPFHWDNRKFTIAEYKRLQGFPDEYIFTGTRNDVIKQIGNSVSPKLSYCLALAIAKQIFERDADISLMPENKTLSFDKRKGQKAKKTKLHHEQVLLKQQSEANNSFSFKSYETYTTPSSIPAHRTNTVITAEKNKVKIIVYSDLCRAQFAKMKIVVAQDRDFNKKADAYIEVIVYGKSDYTIQTMWNAVDNWVIDSSSLHSLFELYGHFTEPHPIFKITEFKIYTDHPIGQFAKHCASFSNCSKHFPREHLTDLFGVSFKQNSFVSLVEILRKHRFDIRCIETNITMPKDRYMVCYPFTLPHNKQMNFSVKKQSKHIIEDMKEMYSIR